jgi:hypothetical protein
MFSIASLITTRQAVPSVRQIPQHLASVSKCQRYQIDLLHIEKRDRMNIGQITDEIYKVVANYHVASMGNDNGEIAEASDEYQRVIKVYGTKAVGEVVRYYNENVIGKA